VLYNGSPSKDRVNAIDHISMVFQELMQLIILHPTLPINEYLQPTSTELNRIFKWNRCLPQTYPMCIHEEIANQAHQAPFKDAICSWDGNLTYIQLDEYSTALALELGQKGIQSHDFIAVCFEKSRWAAVATLAVMKAGATFVMIDPALPLARLENMVTQINAQAILTSRNQISLTSSLAVADMTIPVPLVVDLNTFAITKKAEISTTLTKVDPATLMYIIFTSGSTGEKISPMLVESLTNRDTGTPKGVKISHESYTSSAFPRSQAVGYTNKSRVLDFASYAFDVSIDSMFLTFMRGGTLCIPSDEDRMNDINKVIREMRVNYAGLTPTVARVLDEDLIASLDALGLGGEAVSARDVARWGELTRIVIGYGPCETTIGCTINSSAASGQNYVSMGAGNGANIWIVDPEDHNRLLCPGASGEIFVEGPIVGQGYLNDPEKTRAAFIEDPVWLTAGQGSCPGRRGRMYKTGDLGRYDPTGNGEIIFAGRKDAQQVKIRGQRVELSEIECQILERLPSDTRVTVEVISPTGAPALLVAFVARMSPVAVDQVPVHIVKPAEPLRSALANISEELAMVLPRYMVPNTFACVNRIPTLISGKIDRRSLKAFGVSVDLRALNEIDDQNPNLDEKEKVVRRIWASVLHIDEEAIRRDSNFFSLGGSSISAMKVVAMCRSEGMVTCVADIFGYPVLTDLGAKVIPQANDTTEEIPPFSMIHGDVEEARRSAALLCDVEVSKIVDIYPGTPTQESLFTFSLKSDVPYIAQRVAVIPPDTDLATFKAAWSIVVAATPILRTRICQVLDVGLHQVLLDDEIAWAEPVDIALAHYLDQDKLDIMGLGSRLARYAIVRDPDGTRYVVWTIHHVLYDGFSEPLILDSVAEAWEGHEITQRPTMKDFVYHLNSANGETGAAYWRAELHGADGPQFPELPYRDYTAAADSRAEHRVQLMLPQGFPFTMATIIRGAWALVASKHTDSNDVVFGETLIGRDISLHGADQVLGPMIATVPIRIRSNLSDSVEKYLQSIQASSANRSAHQHLGMQNIRKVSEYAQRACETGTGFIIQPERSSSTIALGFESKDPAEEALHFNPYALMIAIGLNATGFVARASFDSKVVDSERLNRMLAQLATVVARFVTSPESALSDIAVSSTAELEEIWRQRCSAPLRLDPISGRLRADKTIATTSYPPAAVQWVCDARNPYMLMPFDCVGELWLESDALPGEAIVDATWLSKGTSTTAGRPGSIHATGDLVKLRPSGEIVFVRRKEDTQSVKGHVVDIPEIESQINKYLGASGTAVLAVISSDSLDPRIRKEEIIALVESTPTDKFDVKLLDSTYLVQSSNGEEASAVIGDKMPAKAVECIDAFNRFGRQCLPAYMIPTTWVPINGQPSRDAIRRMASRIPEDVLAALRRGYEQALVMQTSTSLMTEKEKVLRQAWAEQLGISVDRIDHDDNFFRLGGDSVSVMKLVKDLRRSGFILSVGDCFRYMRLSRLAEAMKVDERREATISPVRYEACSLIPSLGSPDSCRELISKSLRRSTSDIKDVYPVTSAQRRDVMDSIKGMRTAIQYTILTFPANAVDVDRLHRAWHKLVRTHHILRTVFVEHDSMILQVVLEDLHILVKQSTSAGDLATTVKDLCYADGETSFELGSAFVRTFQIQGIDGAHSFIICLSHALYDGVSLPKMLQDLETFYRDGESAGVEAVPFSTYVAHSLNRDVQKKAQAYWRELLLGSTLTGIRELGLTPDGSGKTTFIHRKVEKYMARGVITPATLISTAWGLVLSDRLNNSDVVFGMVTSGRGGCPEPAAQADGPTYQFTPLRVKISSSMTAAGLLNSVQEQTAAEHDHLGFESIAQECTTWSEGKDAKTSVFFESVVHHQPQAEDVNAMRFAGESCALSLHKPAGDAANPLKVVSFFEDGNLHAGLVGWKSEERVLEDVLDSLLVKVQYLMQEHI
jgi:non-ribosomal peptide synthetase component F/aryl carrier-like protein